MQRFHRKPLLRRNVHMDPLLTTRYQTMPTESGNVSGTVNFSSSQEPGCLAAVPFSGRKAHRRKQCPWPPLCSMFQASLTLCHRKLCQKYQTPTKELTHNIQTEPQNHRMCRMFRYQIAWGWRLCERKVVESDTMIMLWHHGLSFCSRARGRGWGPGVEAGGIRSFLFLVLLSLLSSSSSENAVVESAALSCRRWTKL